MTANEHGAIASASDSQIGDVHRINRRDDHRQRCGRIDSNDVGLASVGRDIAACKSAKGDVV